MFYLRVSFSQHSLKYPQKQTERRILFLFLLFALFSVYLYLFKNLAITCSVLSLLLTDSPIYSKRFSEFVTESKYVLKDLAILSFSETILSFSFNAILEQPRECFFEKYGLQVFQNGLIAFYMFHLSKYSLLHSFLRYKHPYL